MNAQERLRMWAAFLHAHEAVMGAVSEELRRRRGLPLTDLEVLVRLAEQPERRMRMHDLAEVALLSKSGLTRLVDRMEQAGLVERRSCVHDRRGTFAVLTTRGRKALEDARPDALKAIEEHFCGLLSKREAETMLSAFRKILEAHSRRAGLDACGDA